MGANNRIFAYNRVMSVREKTTVEIQEPEALTPAPLATIDRTGRWEIGTKGVTFDEAMERARNRVLRKSRGEL